jgi:hypothetical protein
MWQEKILIVLTSHPMEVLPMPKARKITRTKEMSPKAMKKTKAGLAGLAEINKGLGDRTKVLAR